MPQRRSSKRRLLIVSDSLGGFSKPVADALGRYVRTAHGSAVDVTHLDLFDEFLAGVGVLAKLAYQHTEPFLPSLVGTLAQAKQQTPGNAVLHEIESGGLERYAARLDVLAPDVVIGVSPVAAAMSAELAVQRSFVTASVLATFSLNRTWVHPGCDLFFAFTREVREELVMRGLPYNRVVISGVPFVESGVYPAARSEVRKSSGIADRFTAVVGEAGGSSADTRRIAAGLADRGIQTAVLSGGDARMAGRLEALSAEDGLMRIVDASMTTSVVMSADVALARAGGATLLEALHAGIPSVIYNPIPGQETDNVDFLVNAGASMIARDDDDAIEKVRFLSTHPERLAQMASVARELGKGNAGQVIGERALATVR